MSRIEYKEKNKSLESWEVALVAASFGATLPSPASAIAAATIINAANEDKEIHRPVAAVNGPSIWKQISSAISEYKRYRRLSKKAGRELDIPFYRAQDIELEVQRYKWIEAEKAGRDIWQERNPKDPEGVALRDWVRNYLENWKKDNLGTTQPA